MCAYCPTGMTEIQSYRYGSQTTSQNMYTQFSLCDRSLVEAGTLITRLIP